MYYDNYCNVFDNSIVCFNRNRVLRDLKKLSKEMPNSSNKRIKQIIYVLGYNLGVDNGADEEHNKNLLSLKTKDFYKIELDFVPLNMGNGKPKSFIKYFKYCYTLGYDCGFDEAVLNVSLPTNIDDSDDVLPYTPYYSD